MARLFIRNTTIFNFKDYLRPSKTEIAKVTAYTPDAEETAIIAAGTTVNRPSLNRILHNQPVKMLCYRINLLIWFHAIVYFLYIISISACKPVTKHHVRRLPAQMLADSKVTHSSIFA